MAAEEILRFALFKEVLKADKTRKRRKLDKNGRRRAGSGSGSESGEEEDAEGEEEEGDGEVVDAETAARDARAAEKAKRMEMPSQTPEVQGPAGGEDAAMQQDGQAGIPQGISSERYVFTVPLVPHLLSPFLLQITTLPNAPVRGVEQLCVGRRRLHPD